MSKNPTAKLLMAILVSLALLGSGLYVILTFDWAANPQMVAAATGWIGLVIGYWLK